jgi:hypothetical protein
MTSPLQADIAKLRETSRLRIIGLPSDTLRLVDGPALARVLDALEARTEALKWYADPANNGKRTWTENSTSASVSTPGWRPIDDDEGETARTALEEATRG